MEPELIGVDEAARILGLGRTALYRLIREQQIPLIKLGRSARISVAALRRFVEQKNAEASGRDAE